MNATTTKELKKFNQHLYQIELQELSKLIRLVKQQDEILEAESVTTTQEFEDKLVENSPFNSVKLAALDAGKEDVLNQLHNLDTQLDGKVSKDDLTKDYKFKLKFLTNLQEKYSEYFTEAEIALNKKLKEIIDLYNALPIQHRHKLVVNRSNEMQVNPMLYRY